jgi:glycosyltransferase involved in cell wall biosynthesis
VARLRVLTVSKPYVAAAYRRKLALWAEDERLEVGLVCPEAWGTQAFEPELGERRYWLKTLPVALNGKNHFHFYRGLDAAVREFRPDVMNVEEEHYSYVTWQAFRIAKAVGAKPVFYTWQNIQKCYPPPFSWIERAVFAAAPAAIAGNAEAAAILRAKGYRRPVHEIPQMGVNLSLFTSRDAAATRAAKRQELGLRADAFLVGFVGRLVAEKGVGSLIDALSTLPQTVELLVIGDGPDREAFAAHAAASPAAARIRFVPQVGSAQVAAWIQALDVLCLPSLTRPNWKEQFGRVLVEAMAAETLVVGSDSGEIPHVIDGAGLVFPEGDAAALALRLRSLLDDAALRATLRGKGRRRAETLYADDVVARRFADVFLDVAAGR